MSELSGEAIAALYREVVMEHYRHPRHRQPLVHPDASALLVNPLCGDQVEVEVSLEGSHVAGISARARGCSIVVAAASVMSELVQGLDRAGVFERRALLERLVAGRAAEQELQELEPRLRAFARIAEVPARERCATLPWEALSEALERQAAGPGQART